MLTGTINDRDFITYCKCISLARRAKEAAERQAVHKPSFDSNDINLAIGGNRRACQDSRIASDLYTNLGVTSGIRHELESINKEMG